MEGMEVVVEGEEVEGEEEQEEEVKLKQQTDMLRRWQPPSPLLPALCLQPIRLSVVASSRYVSATRKAL